MKIEIKNWITGNVIFTGEYDSLCVGLVIAVKSRVDLFGANLTGANLSGVDLSRAYLSGANLSRAYLSGVDLSRAYLSGVNLDQKYNYLSISPIGSENGCLWTMRNTEGILILTRGCFSGTIPEFLAAVAKKHSGTKIEHDYIAAVNFIKQKLNVDDNGNLRGVK